ncbi:MAG: hypothetical protein ACXWLH_02080 [Candidatus Saccharimonadales bacterium]
MKIAKLKLSFRAKALIIGIGSTLGLTIAMTAPAYASSSFSDHLWKFANGAATNTIDFNKGASKIYDNGNLHLATDDNLYLDAINTYIKTNAQLGGTLKVVNTATHSYTGSRIYDNGQLHIATDDHMYLDAPSDVNVSNVLNVGASSSVYTGSTNKNCDEACVDLTPGDEGGSNAVFEFQGSGSATESSGISLNSDTINMWSPGDVGTLRVYDEDNFCTNCTLGEVGDTSDGVVAALFEVDGEGGIQAAGDSHFYSDLAVDGNSTFNGDVTVNGDLIADYNIDNTLDGVTSNFEVGNDGGGDLTVWGDTYTNSLFVGNDSCCSVAEFLDGSYAQFDYNGGTDNWQQSVQDGSFILYNSYNDFNALTVDESGNTTIEGPSRHATLTLANDGDLQVDGNTTLGSSSWDNLDVNAEANFNAETYFNDNVTLNYSHLYFNYGCGGGCDQWNMYANTDSGDFILNNLNTGTDVLAVDEGGDVTITGQNRHATLTLANDGDLQVDGNTTLGSSSWDNLDVNANANFYGNNLYVSSDTYAEFEGDVEIEHNLYTDNGIQIYRDDWDYGNLLTATDADYNDLLNVNSSCDGDAYSCVTVGQSNNGGEFDVNTDYVSLGNNISNWNCWSNNCSSIYLNGRLYSDSGMISVGRSSYNQDFRVWGNTDLRGDLSVEGNNATINTDTVTLGNGTGGYNCFISGPCSVINLNGRLYSDTGEVTLGRKSNGQDLRVWGDTNISGDLDAEGDTITLGHNTGDWNCWSDNCSTINLDGRIFSNTQYVTLGRSSDEQDLRVWGDSDLRGDVDVQNDLTVNGSNTYLNSDYVSIGNGTSDWNCWSNSCSSIYLNGRLFSDSGMISIGRSSNNQDFRVWGDTDVQSDLNVEGDSYVEYLNVDNGMDVYGSTNIYGNLYSNGTTTLGDLHVTGATTFDTAATFAGNPLFSGNPTFNSNPTFSGNPTFSNSPTFSGNTNFSGSLTAIGAVNFSGATSLRVPVVGTAITDNTTTCSNTGQVTFSTNDNHFYGCDGVHWQVLDN